MNDIFLPRPGTSSFDLTARLYGGEDAWLRAKNNGRTELDYVQWVQVRTPEFKEAYGDWEGLLHKQFLEDNPVCRVYGNEIPKYGTQISENVSQWYEKNYNGKIFVQDVGTVMLDKNAVKDSLSHGMGRNKYAAYAAVPDVLQNGKIVKAGVLKNAPDDSRFLYFAAPIEIKDEAFACVVGVKVTPDISRMYVHEVGSKKELREVEFSTGPNPAYAYEGMSPGSTKPGAIKSLLQQIYRVKSEHLSVPVNPVSGEPAHDFLLSRQEPPLIDLTGLCPREAGRKLFQETQGNIHHLALMEASAAFVGLRLDKEAIKKVQGQHPLAIHDAMLKALRPDRQLPLRTQDKERTR